MFLSNKNYLAGIAWALRGNPTMNEKKSQAPALVSSWLFSGKVAGSGENTGDGLRAGHGSSTHTAYLDKLLQSSCGLLHYFNEALAKMSPPSFAQKAIQDAYQNVWRLAKDSRLSSEEESTQTNNSSKNSLK